MPELPLDDGQVGSATRTGWLEQPTCQACHHNGKRDTSAVNARGVLKKPTDKRFATTPNVPSTGFNLYRFSTGHGGPAVRGLPRRDARRIHEFASSDNILSTQVQGHVGTIAECTACHATPPVTSKGGHGLPRSAAQVG